MASVAPVWAHVPKTRVKKVSWALGAGDTGQKANLSDFPDRTVQITGTFGSVTLRGSNLDNPDDTNAAHWFNLRDPQGNAITLTANDGKLIAENPLWISPITTGGSGYLVAISAVD